MLLTNLLEVSNETHFSDKNESEDGVSVADVKDGVNIEYRWHGDFDTIEDRNKIKAEGGTIAVHCVPLVDWVGHKQPMWYPFSGLIMELLPRGKYRRLGYIPVLPPGHDSRGMYIKKQEFEII